MDQGLQTALIVGGGLLALEMFKGSSPSEPATLPNPAANPRIPFPTDPGRVGGNLYTPGGTDVGLGPGPRTKTVAYPYDPGRVGGNLYVPGTVDTGPAALPGWTRVEPAQLGRRPDAAPWVKSTQPGTESGGPGGNLYNPTGVDVPTFQGLRGLGLEVQYVTTPGPNYGKVIAPEGSVVSGGNYIILPDGTGFPISAIQGGQVNPVQLPAGWQAAQPGIYNALDRVTPLPGQLAQAQTQNVLNAPGYGSPVQPGSLVQNQGIAQGTQVGANALPSGVTSWIEGNWPLLAVAAVGLYFVTKGK